MIKIGWASRNVSTNAPVDIPGQFFKRISKKCMDEITVTALVIEREDTAIMVSGDFVSATDGIIHDIRAAVKAKNADIPVENILYNVTHTHSSPRYMTSYIPSYDNERGAEVEPPEIYRTFLVNSISDAIVEAYEKRAEGSFAYGYGTASVGLSRRVVYFDDLSLRGNERGNSLTVNKYVSTYGETNDEQFSGYEGVLDSKVNFLFTFDKDEKLTGAIINVACPSQCGEEENYLSSDYWYYARKLIRERYGDIYILPQCAAAGDVAPHVLHEKEASLRRHLLKYSDNEEIMKVYEESIRKDRFLLKVDLGERIANAFFEAYPWISKEKIKDAPVCHNVETIPLEAWKITDEQYEEAKKKYEEYSQMETVIDAKGHNKKGAILGRYKSTIERYEKDINFCPSEVHTIRIGDVAFASNVFELYTDYQHRIQARSPFVQTFIVQLAATTGVSGYLCTQRAKENMGYGSIIYSCPVSPEGGQTLVNRTLASLNELKDRG